MLRKAGSKATTGTSLSGYLQAPRWLVEMMFDKPHFSESGDDKVNASWAFYVNGKVITIYDYKAGFASESPDFSDWHLGSKSAKVVEEFADFLEKEFELEITKTDAYGYPVIQIDATDIERYDDAFRL